MTLEIYDSSVILVQKVSSRTRGDHEENFRTTTLAEFGQSSRRVSRGAARWRDMPISDNGCPA